MILYHVSTTMRNPQKRLFYPAIPKSAGENENQTIKRICFSDTIRSCVQATGYLIKQWDYLIVYRIDTKDIPDKYILTPDDLVKNDYVPDAKFTHEYWITKPISMAGQAYKVIMADYRKPNEKEALFAKQILTNIWLKPVDYKHINIHP